MFKYINIKKGEKYNVVIPAGGEGSRFKNISQTKILVKFNNKIFLNYLLKKLNFYGFKKPIILISKTNKRLLDFIKAHHKNAGIIIEKKKLDTAGAIVKNINLFDKNFLVVMGDIFCNFNFKKMNNYHLKYNNDLTIFGHPNDHNFDSDILDIKLNGDLKNIIFKKENKKKINKNNLVSGGIYLFKKKKISSYNFNMKVSLEKNLIKKLLQNKCKIKIYKTCEYVKDFGTTNRYFQVLKDINKKKINKGALNKKNSAIFLDRDGVIVKNYEKIDSLKKIQLIKNVDRAIKKINKSNYLAIVITNQPVIAKGFVTFEKYKKMQDKIEYLLQLKNGAYVNDWFFCPHHPEKGFHGEVPYLKKKCLCRKPSPGLIFEASKKHNINLKKSYMIGDNDTDVLAGLKAGCKSYKIKNEADFLKIINKIL